MQSDQIADAAQQTKGVRVLAEPGYEQPGAGADILEGATARVAQDPAGAVTTLGEVVRSSTNGGVGADRDAGGGVRGLINFLHLHKPQIFHYKIAIYLTLRFEFWIFLLI